MISCIKTNSENPDFLKLVSELDAELKIIDGNEHDFYSQYNKTDNIRYVIVAYEDGSPAGCGAVKEYSDDTMEIKRMYVPLEIRGKGIASIILIELEKWTLELGYVKCILETGKKQTEAVRLYSKNGYIGIPNFGQYKDKENSLCFIKSLLEIM